jgi:hypothetical protein
VALKSLSEEGLLDKIRNWVREICSNADHLLRTEYWLLELNSEIDLASRIAALTHDIERAFPKGRKPPSPEMTGAKWDDPLYNKWHGERSANFTGQQLRKLGAKETIINKVKFLIEFHEFGGDPEVDLIKDADSLSFLEVNVPLFVSWIPDKMSKEEVREKIDHMFYRISSPKSRKLALPFYQEAVSFLKKL